MTDLTTDEYHNVTNSLDTYQVMASYLTNYKSLVFAWTDQESSQLDILMVYRPMQFGSLQRGMSATKDLFVAVAGMGMFGFALNGSWKAPGYVAEKLGMKEYAESSTVKALAELINGICDELHPSDKH